MSAGRSEDFAVVVCTRDRPAQLQRTLDALAAQRDLFRVVVVDQSAAADAGLAARAEVDGRLTVVRDDGRGLSRARNLGARATDSPWVVFVDDDCLPEPDWAARLAEALARHGDVVLVAPHVGAGPAANGGRLDVTTFPVQRAARRWGRWTHPGLIGNGVCQAVRRDAIEALGGWDERLGPGAEDFPAADDADFNYRLLRSGRVAYVTPEARAVHEQWRAPADLPSLYRGYLTAWGGFAAKHVRTGDRLGGLWLLALGLVDALDVLADAARLRSRLHLAVATAKLRGLWSGTRKGLARSW